MEKKNLSISFTAYRVIDEKGVNKAVRNARKIINFSHLINSCDIGLSTVMVKSSVIKNNFYFPSLKTKEDYVFWLNIAKKILTFTV